MLNSLCHITEVHRREIRLPQAEVPALFMRLPDARGHYERLARNASIVETIAAQLAFLSIRSVFAPS